MDAKRSQPAKLTPPVLPEILDRPRLHRLLDRARKRPAVWVGAPPGSGKTTLVTAYARARKLRPLWYQIDSGDADSATFFHYMVLAAEAAAPRYKHRLPHLTPEYLPGLPTFTRRFFEQWFARLGKGALVIFDNYQDVPDQAPLHELMAIGLEAIPRGVSVVIVSRAAAPEEFSRLQAGRSLASIDADALRLTETESNRLLRLTAGNRGWRAPRRQVAKDLYEKTQGWIAGLILLLEQGGIGGEQAAEDVSQTPRAVADYLMREVLAHCNPAVASFLLKTALLPAMTDAMARELTRLPDAAEVLADLYRKRYFTLRFAGDPPLYRYHPLLREFLLERARRTVDAATLTAWREEAAGVLERSGRLEEVVALYSESGNEAELCRIIVTHAADLLSQGRAQVVEEWIGRVPPAVLRERPWLMFWLAAARLPFNPGDARRWFERAYERFRASDDYAGTLLALSGVVDAIWYAWENLEEIDPWTDRLAKLAPPQAKLPSPEIGAKVAAAMFSALFWRRPNPAEIGPWERKVVEELETVRQFSPQHTVTAIALINYYVVVGEIAKAKHVVELMNAASRHGPMSPVAEIGKYHAEAVVAVVLGDGAGHESLVARGLKLARETGVLTWNVPLLGAKCLGALSGGDLATAKQCVDEMLAHSRDGALVFRSWAMSLHCRVAFASGDVHEALRSAETGLRLTVREGPFPEALTRLAAARSLHVLGRADEAALHLSRAREIAQTIRSPLLEIGWRMTAAELAFDEQRDGVGLDELRFGLRVGAATGIMEWQGPSSPAGLARLCGKALEAGIEPDYVLRLIAKHRLKPSGSAADIDSWPWPIKIFTLGRFEVVKDRRPVLFPRKAQKRPLELLKVLVAFGGRGVSEARVIEALWPEASGDAAYHALTMALKRLRTLLGHDTAVIFSNHRLTLNPELCWVDVWALQRGLTRAIAADAADAKLLSLYKGPFLEQEDAPWALSLRERLRAKILSRVSSWGRQLETRGQWAEAIEWYQRGLEVDDLAENLYQRLMVCHDRLGQRGEALSVYRRCARTFAAHLDALPSKKTRAIYEAVRSGR